MYRLYVCIGLLILIQRLLVCLSVVDEEGRGNNHNCDTNYREDVGTYAAGGREGVELGILHGCYLWFRNRILRDSYSRCIRSINGVTFRSHNLFECIRPDIKAFDSCNTFFIGSNELIY